MNNTSRILKAGTDGSNRGKFNLFSLTNHFFSTVNCIFEFCCEFFQGRLFPKSARVHPYGRVAQLEAAGFLCIGVCFHLLQRCLVRQQFVLPAHRVFQLLRCDGNGDRVRWRIRGTCRACARPSATFFWNRSALETCYFETKPPVSIFSWQWRCLRFQFGCSWYQ